MSVVVERFIGELQAVLTRTAQESLTNVPDANKTAFGFGVAVGRLEGLRLAQETLNNVLNTPEPDSEPRRRRNSPP